MMINQGTFGQSRISFAYLMATKATSWYDAKDVNDVAAANVPVYPSIPVHFELATSWYDAKDIT